MIDDIRNEKVVRIRDTLSDLLAKKIRAEDGLAAYKRSSERSEELMRFLALQRFNSLVDVQQMSKRIAARLDSYGSNRTAETTIRKAVKEYKERVWEYKQHLLHQRQR
jgi:hypothetical protein